MRNSRGLLGLMGSLVLAGMLCIGLAFTYAVDPGPPPTMQLERVEP